MGGEKLHFAQDVYYKNHIPAKFITVSNDPVGGYDAVIFIQETKETKRVHFEEIMFKKFLPTSYNQEDSYEKVKSEIDYYHKRMFRSGGDLLVPPNWKKDFSFLNETEFLKMVHRLYVELDSIFRIEEYYTANIDWSKTEYEDLVKGALKEFDKIRSGKYLGDYHRMNPGCDISIVLNSYKRIKNDLQNAQLD